MINWIKTSDRLPVIPEGETESAALLLYYPDPEIGYYRNTGKWFKEDPYWQELDSPDYWSEINPPGEATAPEYAFLRPIDLGCKNHEEFAALPPKEQARRIEKAWR